MESVSDDRRAVVCACSSFVPNRCHCTGSSPLAVCTSRPVLLLTSWSLLVAESCPEDAETTGYPRPATEGSARGYPRPPIEGDPRHGTGVLCGSSTEDAEAVLCLSVGMSEACDDHEEMLCLWLGAWTAGEFKPVEAVMAAAGPGTGKGWCLGANLGADCGGTACPACKA